MPEDRDMSPGEVAEEVEKFSDAPAQVREYPAVYDSDALAQCAKCVEGWWMPYGEVQFANVLTAEGVKEWKRPIMYGRRAPGYHKIKAALELLPGDRLTCAVDVGANVGWWTVWLVNFFDYVLAFEPVPINLLCLHANLIEEINSAKTLSLQQVALGAYPSRVSMNVNKENCGHAFVEPLGDEVEQRALDQFGLSSLDLLKVDVEGYEREVLKGGEGTIRKFKPVIVFEAAGMAEKHYGAPSSAIFGMLKSWGAEELRPEIKGDHFWGWR